MLIDCPKCSAQYPVDASLIPPSGVMMRCPACLHTFPIHPQPGLPMEEEFTPPEGHQVPPPPPALPFVPPPAEPLLALDEDADLPVPKDGLRRSTGSPAVGGGRRTEAVDLPAPKRATPRPALPVAAPLSEPVLLLDSIPPPPAVAPESGLQDLPAPRGPARAPAKGPAPAGAVDLPAPVGRLPRGGGLGPAALPPGVVDLPAPVGPAGRGAPDLVAPVGPSGRGVSDLVAPVGPAGRGAPDLVAPVGPSSRGAPDLVAPVGPAARGNPPLAPRARGVADLPAPIQRTRLGPALADLPGLVEADLPAPVSSQAELPAPVLAELPAPVVADLPSPVLADLPSPVLAELPSPVAADLPSPVAADLPSPVAADLPSPVAADLLQPVDPLLGDDDLSLDGVDLPPPPPGPRSQPDRADIDYDEEVADQHTRPISDQPGGDGAAPQGAPTQAPAPGADRRKKRRKLMLIGGAALGALLLIGGGVTGFLLLRGGRGVEAQGTIDRAQFLLMEDTLPSYRRAADLFAEVVGKNPQDQEALALQAQARLAAAARFGVTAEQTKADGLLKQLSPEAQVLPDAVKARALRDLAGGRGKEAARTLGPLAASAASRKDVMAAIYLGWAELRAGNLPAAEKAFRLALQIRPRTPGALVGLGQTKEKANDRKAANVAYADAARALSTHFGAAFGKIRTGDESASESLLLELVTKRAASAAPRELGDAWALLGNRALDLKRNKDAEERLRKGLAADPNHSGARVLLARLLCDQDKLPEATELARKAFKDDPRSVDAAVVLARALIMGKKPLDAAAPLEAAVRQAPKDARVLYWQGRREELVGAAGSDAKAEALYRRAVESDPRYLDAYIALSRVLGRQGNPTEALAALRQVASQAAEDPYMAASLGEAYLTMNEYGKAEEAFRMALEKKPELNPVRLNLAQVLEQGGRLQEAEKELAAVQDRSKSYPGLTERRARLVFKQGRYEDAEAIFLQAAGEPGASADLRLEAAAQNLKSHPKDAQTLIDAVLKEQPRLQRGHVLQATLRYAQGQIGEAAVAAEMAIRLGDSAEAQLVRGQVLLSQGRRPDALAAITAARRAPVEGRAMMLQARLHWEDGQAAEALALTYDFLNRQRDLLADRTVYRPEEVRDLTGGAYLLLGDLQVQAGREELAAKAFEVAVKVKPDWGEAAARHGKALANLGKRAPAIRELARALQLGGDAAPYALETYLLLGDSYRESKQRAEALRAYQKWLSLAPPSAPERHEVEDHVQALSERRHR